MKKLLTTITLSALVGTSASNLKPVFTNSVVNNDFKSNIKLRVTNGTDVPEGKYAWFSSTNINLNLISPNWLLSAHHVFEGATPKDIDRIEIEFKFYNQKNEIVVIKRKIKNFMTWANSKEPNWTHDIALVQLNKPIYDIKPISLYDKLEKPKTNTIATVIGKGVCGVDNNGNRIFPNKLQEANIPILDDSVSKDPRWTFPNGWNPKTEILAGIITGDKRITAAPGDSGGPLFIKQNDKDVLVGIVSGAPVDNTEDNLIDPEPGVFTFVGAFYDWIKENTNNFS
ncbi:serine protease [Spiroplasma endosymbiont of Amphimallon solstitiale]|uniref:S1 family peptidase n=1 Tax=Spiroplasma endosymbiont of Amphimallon solstitiale TaxID=3066288 RepID=UPI00313E37FC